MKELSNNNQGVGVFSPKPLVAALGLTTLLAGSVSAAVLEEVVVTAQKREQNLQDVGIAVSAFTGTQMKELGITRSVDVTGLTPGVHTGGAIAGQNTQFTIRGVRRTILTTSLNRLTRSTWTKATWPLLRRRPSPCLILSVSKY